MRRKLSKTSALLLGAVLLTVSLAGCAQNQPAPAETTESGAADTGAGSEDAGAEAGAESTAGATDPFGVLETPVTITVAQRNFGDATPVGTDAPWTQKYAEYGINLEVEWSADSNQFNDKLNTVIASGDTPDLFQVSSSDQMIQLVRADMAADLTEAYELYASDLVKERFATPAGKAALEAATFDGKLRFIPINLTESLNNMDLCYVRQDWVENLGLEMPETLEELMDLALAFTRDDPDGNGADDTYGLLLQGKDGLNNASSFFTGLGIYPGAWHDGMLFYSKDAAGNVVWDGEKPEMKEGLQMLQNLYKEGAIVRDFATYDGSMGGDDANSGKVGICIGARGYPAWYFHNTYANNPEAKWYAMKMPAKAGTETLIADFQPLNAAYAVSPDCASPEAIIKMLNIVTETSTSGTEMFDAFYVPENRLESGDAFMVPILDPEDERKSTQAVCAAVTAGSPDGVPGSYLQVYENTVKFAADGDPESWRDWNRFYPEPGHAYYVIYEMNKDSVLTKNLWQKLPTETMVPKLAVWKKTVDEAFVRIISGADISEWDTVLENWAALGGDQIKEEVAAGLN